MRQDTCRRPTALAVAAALIFPSIAVPPSSAADYSAPPAISQSLAAPALFSSARPLRIVAEWNAWRPSFSGVNGLGWSWILPSISFLRRDVDDEAVARPGVGLRGASEARSAPRTASAPKTPALVIRPLRSAAEHADVERLATEVYSGGDLKYIRADAQWVAYPEFEYSHRTRVLGIFAHGQLVGSVSITRDRDRSTPLKAFWAERLDAAAALVHAGQARARWAASRKVWSWAGRLFLPGIPFEIEYPEYVGHYQAKRSEGKAFGVVWRYVVKKEYRGNPVALLNVFSALYQTAEAWNLDGAFLNCTAESETKAAADAHGRAPINHSAFYLALGFEKIADLDGMPESDILGEAPPKKAMQLYGTVDHLGAGLERLSRGRWKRSAAPASSAARRPLSHNGLAIKVVSGAAVSAATWLVVHLIHSPLMVPYTVYFPAYFSLHLLASEGWGRLMRDSAAAIGRSVTTATRAVDGGFIAQIVSIAAGLGVITLHYARDAAWMLDLGGHVNHHYLWTTVLTSFGISGAIQAAYRWHEARVLRQPNLRSLVRIQRILYGVGAVLVAVGFYATVAFAAHDQTFYTGWCAIRNPIAGLLAAGIGHLWPRLTQPAPRAERGPGALGTAA